MTKLQTWVQRACDEVGLKVDLDFDVTFPDGRDVRSIARIRDIGDENGMLIFSNYEKVRGCFENLILLGYGYTVFGEPGGNEVFDLESYKEMFSDWGWTEVRN